MLMTDNHSRRVRSFVVPRPSRWVVALGVHHVELELDCKRVYSSIDGSGGFTDGP